MRFTGTGAAELPPTIGVLVVDAKGFSRHDDAAQEHLAVLIPDVLEQACARGGLREVWEHRRFPDSTGDGYLIGFDPAHLPGVVDALPDAIQDELHDRAPGLRARGTTLRLRMSVDVGPVRELTDPRIGSPVGTAMISAHRLVDCTPLRALLARSDPDTTLLAVALSERVVEDVVRAGRSRFSVSEFVRVPVEDPDKAYRGAAHLRVPRPSGDLVAHGLLGLPPDGHDDRPAEPDQGAKPTRTQTNKASGHGVIFANQSGQQNVWR